MLTLTEQPSILRPVSKSRPIRWTLTTNSHVQNNGNQASFSIIFNETGAANGEQITLLGQVFTVDNSTPYTESTFSTTGTQQEVSENFANMIRCSYLFRDWAVYSTFFLSFSNWRVFAYYYEEPVTLQGFTFDVSGLSIDVTFNSTNGQAPIIKDLRIWYRLHFLDGTPVGPAKTAFLPYNISNPVLSGRISIDQSEAIRGTLSTDRPDITENFYPQPESNFVRSYYLKYAEVERQNCIDTPSKAYRTATISATNTVYQLREQREFTQHTYESGSPANFLTTRPVKGLVCGNQYEWLHFYYISGGIYTGTFYVEYRFYMGDTIVNQVSIPYTPKDSENVYRIGVGTANAAIEQNITADTDRYRIRVLAAVELPNGIQGNVEIASPHERTITACGCKAAEVYFLEDTGGWQTVIFESVKQRTQEHEGQEITLPLGFSDERGYINERGGRRNKTYRADNPFTFETERLTRHNRDKYEQLLRSPRHYIRTANTEGEEALRPIVIERATTVTSQNGEVTRLQVTFRYNAETEVH